MIDLDWIDRSTDRATWKKFHRIFRKVGDMPAPYDESYLVERAEIRIMLDRCTEDGKICVVESGMDCDSVRYCHGTIHPTPSVIGYVASRDSTYEWADGPCVVGVCKPSDRPESYSRDLAMEAFENGHPHYITESTV